MKKIIFTIVIIFFSLGIISASSEQDPMPEWVYKDLSTADIHYSVGYGKGNNIYESYKIALNQAYSFFAEWISTAVYEIQIKREDSPETSIWQQNANAFLKDINIEDIYIDEDNGVFILISMPVEYALPQMYGY